MIKGLEEQVERCLAMKPGDRLPVVGSDVFYNEFNKFEQQRIWMPPELFLRLVPSPNPWEWSKLEDIYNGQREGRPMESLTLNVIADTGKVTSHEGRHRARWAYEMGVPCMPVTLIHQCRVRRTSMWSSKPRMYTDFCRAERFIHPSELKPEVRRSEDKKIPRAWQTVTKEPWKPE